MFLVLTGLSYQFLSSQIYEYRYTPPGQLIDIAGYKLHVNCMGSHTGPTVVLESGCGLDSLSWCLVQPGIAQFARVCSYDRAGYGWSDESPNPRLSTYMIQELHTLLKKAAIPQPYILVGHSLGGLNVRMYAMQYPDEVAGIVLVDSIHEDQLTRISWPSSRNRKILTNPFIAKTAAYLGVARFLPTPPVDQSLLTALPPHIQDIYAYKMNTPKFTRTRINEYKGVFPSFQNIKSMERSLGNKPLIVITAGKRQIDYKDNTQLIEPLKQFDGLQAELLSLSTNSKQIIAEKSGHLVPFFQPEIIVEAVREMVKTT